MELKDIIGQHGKSVAHAFKQCGVTSPVTVKDVLLTTVLYKEKFINALVDHIDSEEDSDEFLGINLRKIFKKKDRSKNANDGLDPNTRQTNLPEVVVAAPKKNKGERGQKVRNTFNDILDIVGKGFGIYTGIKGTQQSTESGGGSGVTDPVKEKKKGNYFLIGGIILVVVLLLLVFATKAKK